MAGAVKRRTPFLAARLAAVALGAAALAALCLTVPRSGGGPLELPEEILRKGPDSYFLHLYDPDRLLNATGQVDLDLDNFQRETGTAIIFAGFPALPGGDPSLTLRLAQSWAPGSGRADRGLVVFVFFRERLVKAEVGYGLEEILPDAAVRRLLEETMAVPLREGKAADAVAAASAALRGKLGFLRPASGEGAGGAFALLRRQVPQFLHKVRLAGRIWLAAPIRERLLMAGGVLLLWAAAVWMLADISLALARLARIGRIRLGGHDPAGEVDALLGLSLPLLRAIQAGLIIFVVVTGGAWFMPGTGRFGGGGVWIGF